jgi:predicted amidohydrolase YtcJ
VPVSTTADLLLHGGHILTLDPIRPTAEAVAVSQGRILAVGSQHNLRGLVSASTRTFDCHGATVLPGFIDPHLHLFAWASRFCGVDLTTARSIPAMQNMLRGRLCGLQPGAWLRGYGYDESLLVEKRHPTRQDLDTVSTDHPVILRHRTGHAAVLNSVALRRVGIDCDFVPPLGGVVERDHLSGQPNGVAYELEPFLRPLIPPLPAQDFAAGVQQAGTELLRHGVCSFHDAGAGNTLEDLVLFRRLSTDGILRSRATVMIGIDAFPQAIAAGLAPFQGDAQVRLGSAKIMVHEGPYGIVPQLDALADMVAQVHRQGWQVALHAVEEGAIWAALAAIEQTQRDWPRANHRHRIEHCALCPPPFVEKLQELQAAIVTQPGFLYFYGDKYAAEIDPAAQDWLYRAKSFLAKGVAVTGSSDCPIAPLAPLIGIQTAITRRAHTGMVLNPSEQVSLDEALALFTRAGAWVGFEENFKGTLTPGKLADIIVLDGNLSETAIEKCGALTVRTTIIGGEIVWSA